MSVSVLFVCDVPLYRDGVACSLAATRELDVVGIAGGAEQAFELARHLKPQVVLLDMAMPHAFDVARRIAQKAEQTRVVALAIPEEDGAVIACAEAGIAGYVPRTASVREAIDRVAAVARGEAHCSPRIVGSLLRRIAGLAAERPSTANGGAAAGLTAREAEILALLKQGLSNKMISRRLGIEPATVKNHVHSVFGKLGLRRRAEVAVLLQPAGTACAADEKPAAPDEPPVLENAAG
jgi:DNA-binding NarL/FixJ family response regulator